MQRLRAAIARPWALIAILSFLSYGLLLRSTGFYWDDWPFAWIARFLGPRAFIPAFLPFRPFLGPIFFFTTSLIPPVPVYWQTFALLTHYALGLAAWWALSQLWPEQPRIALTTALFMTIYPGYSQHWVAFTHINQEWIPFLFYLLSFGYTFKAVRSERPQTSTALAILLQICGIFPTEYFFGMEGLRGLLLFSKSSGSLRRRIGETLKRWWPYLIVWSLNATWLVYYYRFGPYNSYGITAADETTHQGLLPEILDSLWKTCFYVWAQIIPLISSSFSAPSSRIAIALIAATFCSLLAVRALFEGAQAERTFSISLIGIGLLGILLGRLPSLAAGLPLRLQSSYDRFMISMMLGASLFAVGLIELLIHNSKIRTLIVCALLALGVGQQFFNANIFRRDWQNQAEIYWELTWRIPALETNTVLLTDQLPIDYETDLSFTAPINWMYADTNQTLTSLPYALLYTEKRLGGSTLRSFAPGTPIVFAYRTAQFSSSTSQALVIYKPANGCLRVLDPSRGDADIYAKLPANITAAIPLSDLGRIIPDPATPASPSAWFPAPAVSWCYYFEKAELAYQQNKYSNVLSLAQQASGRGFSPADLNEWLIFLSAQLRTGDVTSAQALSTKTLAQDAKMHRGVCVVWKRDQPTGPAGNISQIMHDLGCDP